MLFAPARRGEERESAPCCGGRRLLSSPLPPQRIPPASRRHGDPAPPEAAEPAMPPQLPRPPPAHRATFAELPGGGKTSSRLNSTFTLQKSHDTCVPTCAAAGAAGSERARGGPAERRRRGRSAAAAAASPAVARLDRAVLAHDVLHLRLPERHHRALHARLERLHLARPVLGLHRRHVLLLAPEAPQDAGGDLPRAHPLVEHVRHRRQRADVLLELRERLVGGEREDLRQRGGGRRRVCGPQFQVRPRPRR